MAKYKCKGTFYKLPPEAAKHVIFAPQNCAFEAEAPNKIELIKKIVDHATEVHGLEDRRLAPAIMMERVENNIEM